MNIYKKFQAWALYRFNREYEKLISDRKKSLLGSLNGTVVEIGAGTGANLKFYSPGIRYTAIEPNEYAFPYLRIEATRLGLTGLELIRLTSEKLPFPDSSIDAVVSTLVLCTVSSQSVVISEIRRILKPGGQFVFLEHVAAPRGSGMRRFQGLVRPFWKVIADGCNPDRETLEEIEGAGFSRVESERFKIFNTFVSPHIAGRAIK